MTRTIQDDIELEKQAYLWACYEASMWPPDSTLADMWRRHAHRHFTAWQRLRHYVVTDHEAVCRATLTTHAYSDLDGYGA